MLGAYMEDFDRARRATGGQLQAFLRDLIAFENQKSFTVELDTFSLSVSRRFDERMDRYEAQVHKRAQTKTVVTGALTAVACLSVFAVWAKVRRLKRKLLI